MSKKEKKRFRRILISAVLTAAALLVPDVPGWLGYVSVALYLAAYAAFRFVIEFFRGDEVRGGYFGLAFSQIVSLCILFGVALYWILHHKGVIKRAPLDPEDPEVDKYDLFRKPEAIRPAQEAVPPEENE